LGSPAFSCSFRRFTGSGTDRNHPSKPHHNCTPTSNHSATAETTKRRRQICGRWFRN